MKQHVLLLILLICISPVYSQLDIDTWITRGREKIMQKEYSSAIDDLSTLIRFVPDMDDAYYFRGVAKFYIGDYRGAVEDLSSAINVKPYNSDNYSFFFLYRGLAKEKLFDIKGALDDYNMALEVKPGNQDAYLCRGLIYINSKKYDEAIADYTKVLILLNKNNTYAWLYRAIANQLSGQNTDALSDFARAIKLEPRNSEIYVRRGIYYTELKDFKKAIDDFDKAIKYDTTNSFAYYNRARAEVEMNDYKVAMNDYDKAIARDNNNDLIYYCRAELKSRVGDLQGAIADYNNVIRISPNNAFSYFNRGIIWHRMDNFHNAIDDYSQVIRLYADFAPVWVNRSMAKQSLKDYAGAALDYKKASELNASLDSLKQIGKLDTSILFKLMDFKADFGSSDNALAETFDNGFLPFPVFEIGYTPRDTLKDRDIPIYGKLEPSQNDKIKELNRETPSNGEFILSCNNDTLNPEKALQWLSFLKMTDDSNKCAALFASSILKYKSQDYNGAIDGYNQIITLNPNFSLAYFNRANTRHGILSLLRSMNEYNNMVINNNIQSVGGQRFNEQNYSEIIKDYDACLKLDTSFYYAYFNQANVKIELKDFAGAVSAYTKAIETEPKFAEAYYNRGLTNIYIRQKELGCSDLSKAGELGIQKAYSAIRKYCGKN